MAWKIAASRSGEAWALARRQHGVLARRQLLELGFTRRAIAHRVASGRLHPVAAGVYAVGRPQLTRKGRWMAAVLACGDGAVLSHGSAAALWNIGPERRDESEVTVRRRVWPRHPEVKVRARPALPDADITSHEGIPVTTPARTILDRAATLEANAVERHVNEADQLELIDPEELRAWVDAHPGEPGARPLRRILDEATFLLSDTELEVLFRPLARAAGLSQPLSKQKVNSYEVDFWWPDLGLVVETDGFRYHRTAFKQRKDLERDQAHVAAGLVPLRFSHWQVKHAPAHVRATLATVARRLASVA
jgi:very-short-patch-repair endonuclease